MFANICKCLSINDSCQKSKEQLFLILEVILVSVFRRATRLDNAGFVELKLSTHLDVEDDFLTQNIPSMLKKLSRSVEQAC